MKPKFFIFLLLSFFSFTLSAQLIDVKGKIKAKSISRANHVTDEAIDKGLDKAEEGVKGSVKGDGKDTKKEDASAEKSSDKKSEESQAKEQVTSDKPVEAKLESYTKYDFVPGDKVLLFEDFSQDAIGDFPALWTTNGSGEVRTLNNYPGNWLWMNAGDKVYTLMKDLDLPENFILEFDVVPAPKSDPRCSSFEVTLYSGEGEFLDKALYPGKGGFHIGCHQSKWLVRGYSKDNPMLDGSSDIATIDVNKMDHVIIWVQKRRLRIYHKGQKAVDLPTVLYDNMKYKRLRFSLWDQCGLPYITNIRITTAKPDMRSKLLTEGKLVSYGIYFDVNKDVVKPESYGTLKEIAAVMTENPDVRIKIVGHTDADGVDAANLDLSKRRGASVKNELVKTFGIDGSRIESDGLGESQPVAPNDTPANKAMNRRVEFIKL
jgi:OmpA-OmpF porin, OOP family